LDYSTEERPEPPANFTRQKIDATFIRSSARFDALEKQTQQILGAITNTRENLTQDGVLEFLTRMICRAEAANQDEHLKTREMIAELIRKEDPSSTVDVITARIEMLSVDTEQEELLRRSIQKRILEMLKYPEMTNRYEQLVESHPKTFDWIFCSSDKWEFPWTDFGKWLKESQGIYWINGKPASGKSTLMKHIYDDKRTAKYLREWSRGKDGGIQRTRPCCLATFFFWSTGTPLQKSQEGLLRALLFQILGQHPDLIPLVFPTQWAELYTDTLSLGRELVPDAWSSRQLHNAFERLIQQTQYSLNICFFIDGLDEFSGDTEQLCLFFKRLSNMSANTKICLSSRPWVEFKDNFQGCASLRLQDLTANDISTYVNDKLNGSAAFTQLAARDEYLASKLTKEIMERAEGVFLWVKIVVRLLLKGINNKDTAPQLWTRLKSFPTELNGLYETMLSQIEPIYLDWASKAFQCMVASVQLSSDPFRKSTFPAPEVISTQAGADGSNAGVAPLRLIEFSFAFQEDYDLNNKMVLTVDQLISKLQETVLHITARCAGLLEVEGPRTLYGLYASFREIRWMHRTAHDFVRGCKIWTTSIDDDCFRDPFVCSLLMKGSLISIKEFAGKDVERDKKIGDEMFTAALGQEEALISNAMTYAYHANGHSPTRSIRSKLLAGIRAVDELFGISPLPFGSEVLEKATIYCLSDFVEDTLSEDEPRARTKSAQSLLSLLCSMQRFTSTQYPYPTRSIIECLLQMSNFPPRHTVEFQERDWKIWKTKFPGVLGGSIKKGKGGDRKLAPREVSCLIETQLSIIQAFLKADVDPTDSLEYLPRHFVLQIETMQAAVEKSLQFYRDNPSKHKGATITVAIALDHVRLALRDEVSSLSNGRGSAKKRKLHSGERQEVSMLSDDSEPGEGILEEKSVDRGKRLKLREDN
jgi:hypothetical protein